MTNMVALKQSGRTYLPAAGRDIFLLLYDLMATILGADRARQALLDQLRLGPESRVLDIGCGTGTLAVSLKLRFPRAEITGLDPDPNALALASRKAEQKGASLRFDQGYADALAYPTESFDAVLSSFMFHHLEGMDRERALREVLRVLKRAGTLYLIDFEVPEPKSAHGIFHLFRSSERLRDNSETRILGLLEQAGFAGRKKTATLPVLFGLGRVGFFQATRPPVV